MAIRMTPLLILKTLLCARRDTSFGNNDECTRIL